jgi:hypothetical protein
MKIFLFGMLMSLFVLPIPAQATEYETQFPKILMQSDFRGFVWGVSEEDVRNFEKAAFYKEEGDSLYYLEQLSKTDFVRHIRYDFIGNKLVGARYELKNMTFASPETAVDVYDSIKSKIDRARRVRGEESFVWRDKTYLNYPEFWPRAVRNGDLKMRAHWVYADSEQDLSFWFADGRYKILITAQKKGAEVADQPETQTKGVLTPR